MSTRNSTSDHDNFHSNNQEKQATTTHAWPNISREFVIQSIPAMIISVITLVWFTSLGVVLFRNDAACDETLHGWGVFTFWSNLAMGALIAALGITVCMLPKESQDEYPGWVKWLAITLLIGVVCVILAQLVWAILGLGDYDGAAICHGLYVLDSFVFILIGLMCIASCITACL